MSPPKPPLAAIILVIICPAYSMATSYKIFDQDIDCNFPPLPDCEWNWCGHGLTCAEGCTVERNYVEIVRPPCESVYLTRYEHIPGPEQDQQLQVFIRPFINDCRVPNIHPTCDDMNPTCDDCFDPFLAPCDKSVWGHPGDYPLQDRDSTKYVATGTNILKFERRACWSESNCCDFDEDGSCEEEPGYEDCVVLGNLQDTCFTTDVYLRVGGHTPEDISIGSVEIIDLPEYCSYVDLQFPDQFCAPPLSSPAPGLSPYQDEVLIGELVQISATVQAPGAYCYRSIAWCGQAMGGVPVDCEELIDESQSTLTTDPVIEASIRVPNTCGHTWDDPLAMLHVGIRVYETEGNQCQTAPGYPYVDAYVAAKPLFDKFDSPTGGQPKTDSHYVHDSSHRKVPGWFRHWAWDSDDVCDYPLVGTDSHGTTYKWKSTRQLHSTYQDPDVWCQWKFNTKGKPVDEVIVGNGAATCQGYRYLRCSPEREVVPSHDVVGADSMQWCIAHAWGLRDAVDKWGPGGEWAMECSFPPCNGDYFCCDDDGDLLPNWWELDDEQANLGFLPDCANSFPAFPYYDRVKVKGVRRDGTDLRVYAERYAHAEADAAANGFDYSKPGRNSNPPDYERFVGDLCLGQGLEIPDLSPACGLTCDEIFPPGGRSSVGSGTGCAGGEAVEGEHASDIDETTGRSAGALAVSVTTDKEEYFIGEEISVVFTLTNPGPEDVKYTRLLFPFIGNLYFDVTSPNSELMYSFEIGPGLRRWLPGLPPPLDVLWAGESLVIDTVLNNHFPSFPSPELVANVPHSFDVAGAYTIVATYDNYESYGEPGVWLGSVSSAPVQVVLIDPPTP